MTKPIYEKTQDNLRQELWIKSDEDLVLWNNSIRMTFHKDIFPYFPGSCYGHLLQAEVTE